VLIFEYNFKIRIWEVCVFCPVIAIRLLKYEAVLYLVLFMFVGGAGGGVKNGRGD